MKWSLPLIGMALLLGPSWGCSEPGGPPPVGPSGQCNNNGVCNTETETCLSCPTDCSCCNLVAATGNQQVANPAAALGKPDGKGATINPGGVMMLTLGKGIKPIAGNDFQLAGSVTAASDSKDGASGAAVGVTVWIRDDTPGDWTWYQVGVWSSGASGLSGFDVNHSGFVSRAFTLIKLEATFSTRAYLDAVVVATCSN